MALKISQKKALSLFYSYAHEDEKLRDTLAKHLTPLKQQGIISEWYDRQIGAGEVWEDKINEQLESSDIILLFISIDFISSEYCWGKEMTRALERHNAGNARVIPIILRPVDWTGAPFASLQALPKDGKPVTLWPNKEVAWVDVAKGIKQAAEALIAGLPVGRPAVSQLIVTANQAVSAEPSIKRKTKRRTGNLQRTVYDAENRTNLPGRIRRQEGDSASGDQAVDEAYEGLGAAYNFFWDVYGRDSIDNKGMPLIATVHYDKTYDNAFWNGKQIIFGDGDEEIFNRFTIAVDVIAKEYANGVIQSQTRLTYWQESGALFNSLASVFACMVKQYLFQQTADQADWLLGAGLFTRKSKIKAISSLADPGTAYANTVLGTDPQPSHMRDYVRTSEDNGGIHINSGIPNRAFYLIATALGGYSWEKAGLIWYEALKEKTLKPNLRFNEFAQLTLSTAKRLFGSNCDESNAIKRGWELVGIKVTGTKPSKKKSV